MKRTSDSLIHFSGPIRTFCKMNAGIMYLLVAMIEEERSFVINRFCTCWSRANFARNSKKSGINIKKLSNIRVNPFDFRMSHEKTKLSKTQISMKRLKLFKRFLVSYLTLSLILQTLPTHRSFNWFFTLLFNGELNDMQGMPVTGDPRDNQPD